MAKRPSSNNYTPPTKLPNNNDATEPHPIFDSPPSDIISHPIFDSPHLLEHILKSVSFKSQAERKMYLNTVALVSRQFANSVYRLWTAYTMMFDYVNQNPLPMPTCKRIYMQIPVKWNGTKMVIRSSMVLLLSKLRPLVHPKCVLRIAMTSAVSSPKIEHPRPIINVWPRIRLFTNNLYQTISYQNYLSHAKLFHEALQLCTNLAAVETVKLSSDAWIDMSIFPTSTKLIFGRRSNLSYFIHEQGHTFTNAQTTMREIRNSYDGFSVYVKVLKLDVNIRKLQQLFRSIQTVKSDSIVQFAQLLLLISYAPGSTITAIIKDFDIPTVHQSQLDNIKLAFDSVQLSMLNSEVIPRLTNNATIARVANDRFIVSNNQVT